MEIKEFEFTQAMKDRLSKSTAIDISKTFLYTPEAFREKDENGNYVFPKDSWTVYKLRLLSSVETARMRDMCTKTVIGMSGSPEIEFREGEHKIMTLKRAIKGWKNVYKEGFTETHPFKEEFITDGELSNHALGSLSESDQNEIWMVVMNNLKLNEEELMGLDY